MIKTPLLYLIYNRPDICRQSFEIIKAVKPTILYVAADGPKNDYDATLCNKSRDVLSQIDWPCEVHTLFREKNLGCREAVSSAIDWFFKHVEEGIILEDDCIPDLSFFQFCEELLDKYRDTERVMHIGGNNFQKKIPYGKYDYYFSRMNHIWGWATWKRAWKHYDVNESDYPDFIKNNKIKSLFSTLEEKAFWLRVFKYGYEKTVDTWDFQWTYTIANHDGVAVIPKFNLVRNIGFTESASHTVSMNKNIGTHIYKMEFPLKHPPTIVVDKNADRYTYEAILRKPSTFTQQLLNTARLYYQHIKSYYQQTFH